MELYAQILDSGGPSFGTILRHVRDRPNEGCIFHCTGRCQSLELGFASHPATAGKDRTGVIAAIILKVRRILSPWG